MAVIIALFKFLSFIAAFCIYGLMQQVLLLNLHVGHVILLTLLQKAVNMCKMSLYSKIFLQIFV